MTRGATQFAWYYATSEIILVHEVVHPADGSPSYRVHELPVDVTIDKY